MPGLPRKSTVKQFKKLAAKSGKSRTNKAAGGSDPSTRRIATYEQFKKFYEGIKWYSGGEFSEEEFSKMDLKKARNKSFEEGDIVIDIRTSSEFVVRNVRSDGRLDLSQGGHINRFNVNPDGIIKKFEEDLIDIEYVDDVNVNDTIYNNNGEIFGVIRNMADGKIYMDTLAGSKFIMPDYKFLTYKFKKRY